MKLQEFSLIFIYGHYISKDILGDSTDPYVDEALSKFGFLVFKGMDVTWIKKYQ